MAEDCRILDVIGICDCRIPAIERVIGAADTYSLDLHQYFVILDLRNIEIFYVLHCIRLSGGLEKCVHLTFHG